MKIKILIVFLIFFSEHSLRGQSNTISFKSINVENGLSSNNALSILQDQKGLMWFGTKYGLNKYDSYDFTYFQQNKNDSLSLSDDEVKSLYQDREHRLWVGTGNGINLFDAKGNKFHHFNKKTLSSDVSGMYIRTFFEDSKGTLWVGTSKGLFFYKEVENRFVPFSSKPSYQIRINAIKESKDGRIFVGSIHGVYEVRNKKFIPFRILDEQLNARLQNIEVRSIQIDTFSNFWIGTEGRGVFVVDAKGNAKNFTRKNTNYDLLSNYVRVITLTSKGNVWIGTRQGLTVYNPVSQRFRSYQHNVYDDESLSYNSIRDIIEDRDGGMWIATSNGGINYYNPSDHLFSLLHQQLGKDNTLSYNQIKAIAIPENGDLWLGTAGKGLIHYDKKKDHFSNYLSTGKKNKLINNDIKSISLDSLNNLWIGTYDGISYLNTKTKKFTNYSLTKFDSLNPLVNQVHSTLLDKAGNLWAGTNGGGLFFFDLHHNKFVHYKHQKQKPTSLKFDKIMVLFEDQNQRILIGTRRGLDIFSSKTNNFQHFLQGVKVGSIQQDEFGNFWIGSIGEGLFLFNPRGKNKNFRIKDGIAGNVIYAIEEDAENNLWVSTNNGLSKVILKRKEASGEIISAQFLNYKKSDGLQGKQFLQESAFKTANGELFFGGLNGVNYFYPNRISPEINFSPVVLTGLKIKHKDILPKQEKSPLNKNIAYQDTIKLTYNQSEFTIAFAALNYLNSSKNLYAYKLEGFDDKWNYIGKQRNATFTYPPAGEYVFKVKSSTNAEHWPDTYTSIQIEVLPPFWKTSWAYLIYVVLLGLLFYTYHRISTNFSRLKREKELSKSKFEFFTNISHEIKTPLTLILTPLEDLIESNQENTKIHHQLSMMKTNGDRLINLINQLLDFRKFESGAMKLQVAEGNIVKFVTEIFLSFKGLSERKAINFTIEAPEKILLWYDRDKLEKVLLNLLSNAFKFTERQGKIRIVVKEEKGKNRKFKHGYCSIAIENTGITISADKLKTIFKRFVSDENYPAEHTGSGIGLNLARRLVKMHKGDISVESEALNEENSGITKFTIRLPRGKKHLKDNQVLKNFKDSEQISQYVQKEVGAVLPMERSMEIDPEKSSRSKLMLVIEDNEEVRSFVISMFQEDFRIMEAENGEIGKEKALEKIPDIIISDVMMPVLDGITLCNFLKNDQRTSHIPIILLTARTPLIFRVEGIETGADDYVTKPFSTKYLRSRVHNLIENREKINDKFRKELILQPQKLTITSPDEKFLEKVLQYLEDNMSNPDLSVVSIGKEVGMSRSNLYRKIKALTGYTTVQFIRSIRIKRAAQILQDSDMNVNEVAFMVGFQDVDYFSKCFKKEFNTVPSKYSEKKG